MKTTLEMTFRNNTGKDVNLTLSDPKDDLTNAQVQTVMQNILTKNIFTTTGGDLKEIVEAKKRTVDEVTLA